MKTKIINVPPERLEPGKINQIADILKGEGVIVYPTDTFYGLGAVCNSNLAIQKVYRLKKRKPSKPLSIMISNVNMVHSIAANIPPLFWELAGEFWPGPLTMVLKASPEFPKAILGPGESVGIRLPAVELIQEIVRKAGVPITATSANVSGQKEMADPEEVIRFFGGKVDLIVDGGKTEGTWPSTVIDLTGSRPRILRRGAVPASLLRDYLGI